MESFKNTMQVGAEELSIEKERSEVFDFIYKMSSQKEIYEWLRNLQFQAWDEDDYQFYIDKRAYMNFDDPNY